MSTKKGSLGEQPYYPMVGYYFKVSINGIRDEVDSKFMEVSGIDMKLEDGDTIKEGGENASIYEFPGRTTYSDLVLKRGLLKPNTSLIKWCMTFFKNDYAVPLETKDVSVQLLNEKGQAVFTWLFKSAQPKELNISGFKSQASGQEAIVVETIKLKFESFDMVY
ncbi:MAG: phage tail protein [Bacteroidota bacterium]